MKFAVAAFAVTVCVVFACHQSKPGDGENRKNRFRMRRQDPYKKFHIEKLRKTVIIGVHGFNPGYREIMVQFLESSNLGKLINAGVDFPGVLPIFPARAVPNSHAVATGLYAEDNGVVAYKFRDPDTGKTLDVDDPVKKIFRGEPIWETLRKNDLKGACLNWPGCQFEGDIFFNKKLSWEESIKQVSEWLQEPDMRLVMMGYSDIIEIAHYGVRSTEINNKLYQFDEDIGAMIRNLTSIDPENKFNIIIVGTSGVANVDAGKALLAPLPDHDDTLVVDAEDADIQDGVDYDLWAMDETLWLVQPKPNNERNTEKLYNHFKKMGGENVNVLKKEHFPGNWHYKTSDRVPEIIIWPALGYKLYVKNEGEEERTRKFGSDGYAPGFLKAALVAAGPAFKPNSKASTELDMVDVHLLLCKILGVVPPANHKGTDVHFHEFLQERFLESHD